MTFARDVPGQTTKTNEDKEVPNERSREPWSGKPGLALT